MRLFFWVAMGSALGGVARYGVVDAADALLGPALPWGTLIVNVAGSVAIGALAGLVHSRPEVDLPEEAAAFLMTGLCGGFTTFSFFSLQTLTRFAEGAWGEAFTYASLSFALSIAGVALAFRWAARRKVVA